MMTKLLYRILSGRKMEEKWDDTTLKYLITIFQILFSLKPSKLWQKLKRRRRLLLFNVISWKMFQRSLCSQESNRWRNRKSKGRTWWKVVIQWETKTNKNVRWANLKSQWQKAWFAYRTTLKRSSRILWTSYLHSFPAG